MGKWVRLNEVCWKISPYCYERTISDNSSEVLERKEGAVQKVSIFLENT